MKIATGSLFYAEYISDDAPTELVLNDVPQARFGAGSKHLGFIPVPLDLRHGQNTLELRLWQTPGRMVEAGRPFATARLAAFSDGDRAFEEAGVTVAALDLSDGHSVSIDFFSHDGPDRWSWQDASPLTPAILEDAGLQAFLKRLEMAWFEGDPQPFLSASARRFDDAAQAFRTRPPTAMAAAMRTWIEGMGPVPHDLRRLPKLVTRPFGKNRLIELSAPDGEPWLRRLDAKRDPTNFSAIIGLMNGSWYIFR